MLAARIEADVQEARDPRAVPQQGVFRRRALRRRGGLARLLRQARRAADHRRSGAARRPREVAVRLRADGQPAAGHRPAQRRAAGDAREPAPSTRQRRPGKRARAGRAARRRCSSDEPCGQHFKEQVRRELVERFGWQRVYQGGLHVYTTIDPALQQAGRGRGRRSARRSSSKRARQRAEGPARTADARRTIRAAAGGAGRDGPARPAPCARWSAAATSTRARSTAPSRRGGSRARPSSRSSTRRRSKSGYTPATAHRPPRRSDRRRRRATGRPKTSTPTAAAMTLRTGAAHVEQPRRRAAAAAGRHRSATVRLREDARASGRAERAVARARLRRGDAAIADGGVRRRSPTAASLHQPVAHPPRRGPRRARCSTRRKPPATRVISETTAFLMTQMLADVDQRRHRVQGARSSGSRCRRRARPARPTTTTTPGSSASRRTW